MSVHAVHKCAVSLAPHIPSGGFRVHLFSKGQAQGLRPPSPPSLALRSLRWPPACGGSLLQIKRSPGAGERDARGQADGRAWAPQATHLPVKSGHRGAAAPHPWHCVNTLAAAAYPAIGNLSWRAKKNPPGWRVLSLPNDAESSWFVIQVRSYGPIGDCRRHRFKGLEQRHHVGDLLGHQRGNVDAVHQ